jgi:hypothetical protein
MQDFHSWAESAIWLLGCGECGTKQSQTACLRSEASSDQVGHMIWNTDARMARLHLEKHRDRKLRIWHGKLSHLCYISCTIVLHPRSKKQGCSSNLPQAGTEQRGHQDRSHVHVFIYTPKRWSSRQRTYLPPEARGTGRCAGTDQSR